MNRFLAFTFIITFIIALVCSQTKPSCLYPLQVMGSSKFEPRSVIQKVVLKITMI